jgi:hypothetical protein
VEDHCVENRQQKMFKILGQEIFRLLCYVKERWIFYKKQFRAFNIETFPVFVDDLILRFF